MIQTTAIEARLPRRRWSARYGLLRLRARQTGINEVAEIANSTSSGGLVFRAATTTLCSQAVPQSCLRRVATKVNPSRISFANPNGSSSVATQPFRCFVPHPCSGMSVWRVGHIAPLPAAGAPMDPIPSPGVGTADSGLNLLGDRRGLPSCAP